MLVEMLSMKTVTARMLLEPSQAARELRRPSRWVTALLLVQNYFSKTLRIDSQLRHAGPKLPKRVMDSIPAPIWPYFSNLRMMPACMFPLPSSRAFSLQFHQLIFSQACAQ
jgi:hypothetical protein